MNRFTKVAICVALAFGTLGCTTDAQHVENAMRSFEAGESDAALVELERTNRQDYVAGNTLVVVLLSQRKPNSAREALSILGEMNRPAKYSDAVEFYVASLKFIALTQLDQKAEAERSWGAQCASRDPDAVKHCLALKGGVVISSLAAGPDSSKFSSEYARMYSDAFQSVYGMRPFDVLVRRETEL